MGSRARSIEVEPFHIMDELDIGIHELAPGLNALCLVFSLPGGANKSLAYASGHFARYQLHEAVRRPGQDSTAGPV
jgi:hypothetical protein